MKVTTFPVINTDESLPAIQFDNGDWYFAAKETCSFADVATQENAARWTRANVPAKWLQEIKINGKDGRPALYMTKPGFYWAICQGKSEDSLKFRDWVFEVLLLKLEASDRPLEVTSLELQLEAVKENFQGLLDAKDYQIESLKRSLNSRPTPKVETIVVAYPYTPEQLQAVSGIKSIYHVRNSIRLNFKVGVDYLADESGKPIAIAESTYHILILCFRSTDGTDLNKLPELINVRVAAYFAYRAKKQKNRLIAHHDQLPLF